MKVSKKFLVSTLFSVIAACMLLCFSVRFTAQAAEVIDIPSFSTNSGAEIRVLEPSGIRFITEISVSDYGNLPDNAVFGTLIIPTALLDGELTLATPNVLNVITKVWKADADGVKAYNAALVGKDTTSFDEKFYGVNISACGYVTYVDGDEITHTIYSPVTAVRSVAEVAAYALIAGDDAEILTDMVDAVVSSISFTNDDTVYIAKGDSFTATISGNAGLFALFTKTGDISLSDETANTVLVTADDAGSATLTATLGSRTDTISVIVKDYVISSDISSIRGIVGDTHTLTATVTDGGEPVVSGTITYSADAEEATIDGDSITPLVAGDIDITVSYTDINGIVVDKVFTFSANTVDGYLAASLSGNKLVNWSDELWARKVSDTTVSGRSMSKETYTPYVNIPSECYNYVPNDAGTGRTIIFPVQNTYTSGYLKISVTRQGGNYPSYAFIEIYKVGATSTSNYVIRPTGSNVLSGLLTADLYVPVSSLIDANNVLTGVQVLAGGMGWFRIGQMEYVPAGDFTPTFTTTTNLSSINLLEGGSNATVTASISSYCGMPIGTGFGYTFTVTSSDTSVATVSGTTLTPVFGGDTTITVTFTDSKGNTLTTAAQEIHVTSYAEQVAETLGENEFVNWKSQLQTNLLTDTTIDAYKNKTEYVAYHGSPYFTYQFRSTDSASGNAETYAGHNIEFAVKNVYSAEETGYIKLDLLKQRNGGNVYIYKYGATDDNPVYTTGSFSGNTQKTFYVPIKDLINEDGVLEGIQIIMRLDTGTGVTGTGQYYSFTYATAQQAVAQTLGENELVNWKSDAQLALTSNAVISGYNGTLKDTVINRVAAGWYNYQFYSSNNSTGRVQIEFANKNVYTEGYVKIGIALQSGWGQTSYIYKYGQTSGDAVYSFKTTNADRNQRIYHYIPVADLVNGDGVLEGIQVVLTLGSSFGQIYDISYVSELPA